MFSTASQKENCKEKIMFVRSGEDGMMGGYMITKSIGIKAIGMIKRKLV